MSDEPRLRNKRTHKPKHSVVSKKDYLTNKQLAKAQRIKKMKQDRKIVDKKSEIIAEDIEMHTEERVVRTRILPKKAQRERRVKIYNEENCHEECDQESEQDDYNEWVCGIKPHEGPVCQDWINCSLCYTHWASWEQEDQYTARVRTKRGRVTYAKKVNEFFRQMKAPVGFQ